MYGLNDKCNGLEGNVWAEREMHEMERTCMYGLKGKFINWTKMQRLERKCKGR